MNLAPSPSSVRQYSDQDVNRLLQVVDDLIAAISGNGSGPGTPGKSVSLRVNANKLEWQREGDASWISLFDVPAGNDPANYVNFINARLQTSTAQ